jgi:hypothetical protein
LLTLACITEECIDVFTKALDLNDIGLAVKFLTRDKPHMDINDLVTGTNVDGIHLLAYLVIHPCSPSNTVRNELISLVIDFGNAAVDVSRKAVRTPTFSAFVML